MTLTYGTTAFAGVYTDDLGKCLVRSSSADDQIALIKWVFLSMSAHPSVAPYSKFTPDDVAAINKAAGGLFQRLLTVDCRKEAVAALKYEGVSSLEGSFTLLGQIAMRGLMTDSHVAQNLASLGASVDAAKMKELFDEAGIHDQNAPPASH